MSSPDAREKPVALITGAARRLGAAMARRFHERGHRIALHYRSSSGPAQAIAASLGDADVTLFQADIIEPGAPAELARQVLERMGRIDVLVNNASSFFETPIGTVTETVWDDLMGTNLKAPFFLAQAAAGELSARRGAIVNLVDIHARAPIPQYAVYCAAKAGLLMLTRALAIDLAPEVRVNGIAPGVILWPEGPADEVERAETIERIPLRDIGDPEHIAGAAAFLALDAPYVTGEVLAVDGGRGLVKSF